MTPALTISVDGTPIATINTDGLTVVTIHVSGTLTSAEFASLHAIGVSQGGGGPGVPLWWVPLRALHAGERIGVAFAEHGASSHAGKPLEELYPDAPQPAQPGSTPTPALPNQLHGRPKLRQSFSLRLASSFGASYAGTIAPDADGFGFSVLWDTFNAGQARVSLHSHTPALQTVAARDPMRYLVKQHMQYGDSVELELVA